MPYFGAFYYCWYCFGAFLTVLSCEMRQNDAFKYGTKIAKYDLTGC